MVIDEVMRFLKERQPRVLGLGEPLHGVETFPRLRNDLLRELESCRWVALESDCLVGHMVDDYVRGGDGQLDQVMADGINHGFGAWPANRALVEWLREHNRERPPADQVRFAGADAPTEWDGGQSPRVPLRTLHDFLAVHCTPVPHQWSRIETLLGDDDRWTNPDVIMDPSQAIGASVEARELRAITDDLCWLFTSQAPQLTADSSVSVEKLRDAELAARAAAGLCAYHAVLARTDQLDRLTRGLGIRDTMMAANLRALTTRGQVLFFAQNQHVRRGIARMQVGDMDVRWSSAGAHLARTYGPDYVTIAIAIGSAPHLDIDSPPANTLEGLLAASTSTPRLMSAAELAKLVAEAGDLTTRTTRNFAYLPLDLDTAEDFDAVLFMPHIDPDGFGA